MSKRSLSDKIQQEINVANMNGNVHAERAYKRCLNIIRQHEAEHPFKEVDDDGWPLEKPSEISEANIIAIIADAMGGHDYRGKGESIYQAISPYLATREPEA